MTIIADPWFYAVAVPAVILAGISKGGLGGSVGFLSIPLMAQVISPVTAAAIMLPILCLMDIQSWWIYRRRFDGAILRCIIPAAIIGVGVGTLSFRYLDDASIRLIIGVIALGFVINQAIRRLTNRPQAQRNNFKGSVWAAVSGFTSFMAHAGSPPLQVYLLPLRLDKTLYVGTTAIYFAVINYVKLIPYGWLGQLNAANLGTALVLLPLIPVGIALGVWLHKRFTHDWFYRVAFISLTVLGVKLVGDGLGVW